MSDKQAEKFRAAHLLPGETIVATASAHRDKKGLAGLAILTDRRFVFYRAGLTGERIEPWPIEKISSVEADRGFIFLDMRLHTSGDSLDLRFPDKKAGAVLVQHLQDRLHRTGAAAAQPAGADDPLAQIETLARLRDAGAIDEGEFAAKKAELLARL